MNLLVSIPFFALYKLIVVPIGLAFLWLVHRSVVPKYLGFVKLTGGVYATLMLYMWLVFYS